MTKYNFAQLNQQINAPDNFIKRYRNDQIEFQNPTNNLFFVVEIDVYNDNQLTITDDAQTINPFALTSELGTNILRIARKYKIAILDDIQEVIKDTNVETINQDVADFAKALIEFKIAIDQAETN